MKQIASVLLALIAIALPALGETFLSVSDVHFNPFSDPALVPKLEAADVAEWQGILASSGTTAFTTYGSDINDALFRSAVGEMHTQLPSPAFVLISGDFLAHDFQQNYQQYATDKSQTAYTAFVAKTITYIASVFRDAYPNVRIYPTLGNNDSDCGDYAVAPNGAFLKNFRDTWSTIVDSRSFERRFPAGGYYHADVPALDGVRIIAVNTNFFSVNYQNPCGTPGPDAGMRELIWLDDELRLARDLGKRVWLLFHIPPGIDVYDSVAKGACPTPDSQTFWKKQYVEKYLAIVARHRGTIAGSFAGHTHQDEFRFAAGDFVHITPSITPIFGNNPAFEIMNVRRNGDITGYTAWHLPNVTLPWVREYSFDGNYDNAALRQLAAKIDSDENTRVEYFTHMSSGAPKSTAGALAKWQGYWCGFTAMNVKTFTSCYCTP
ncbi:MAG TPA: metallophosphoesterase [Thermoanaerobaculia bacterium]|nr:metallophosphoesterase [Thermoanaerobaculia bacterium]